MRQLNKIQTIIFALGALLMVIGVGCVVFGVTMPMLLKSGAVVYSVGAVCFACMQMSQVYTGSSIVIRRLRRIMVFADVCFIIAAIIMLENAFLIVFPYFAETIDGYNAYIHYIYNAYIHYIYNNWVVALLIAAVLEVYTIHRISYELKKEQE